MSLTEYLRPFGNLSEVKQKILRELWRSDDAVFPKPWVQSSRLLELTGQKYFDRRIRELRDELGCDIETGNIRGEHSYRLLSARLNSANPRFYLSESEKRALFCRHDYTCQVCGGRFLAGVRGLQADHKVPLIRGGVHESTNWQPLCNSCNVAKRRACAGCQEDCQQCPWAFPERVGQLTLIRIPRGILTILEQRVGYDVKLIEEEIVRILAESTIQNFQYLARNSKRH